MKYYKLLFIYSHNMSYLAIWLVPPTYIVSEYHFSAVYATLSGYSPPRSRSYVHATWISNERTTLPTTWRFRGHSLCFKGHCLIKSHVHINFTHRSVITKWSFWHILNWKMSRGSVNNPQLTTNIPGGCLIINFKSKEEFGRI